MKLKLILLDKSLIEVKAHRILKNTFPNLKLYIHYAVKEGEHNYTKGKFTISCEDGISILSSTSSDMSYIVEEVICHISFYGEKRVMEMISKFKKQHGLPLKENKKEVNKSSG